MRGIQKHSCRILEKCVEWLAKTAGKDEGVVRMICPTCGKEGAVAVGTNGLAIRAYCNMCGEEFEVFIISDLPVK